MDRLINRYLILSFLWRNKLKPWGRRRLGLILPLNILCNQRTTTLFYETQSFFLMKLMNMALLLELKRLLTFTLPSFQKFVKSHTQQCNEKFVKASLKTISLSLKLFTSSASNRTSLTSSTLMSHISLQANSTAIPRTRKTGLSRISVSPQASM